MAAPFRLEHWNLLANLANNFKDVSGLNYLLEPETDRSFTIHDTLVQCAFTPFQVNNWFSYGSTWSTSRVLDWDSGSTPLESGVTPWSQSLLPPLETRTDELYDKSVPYGTVSPPPWPDVSKLTTSMIDGLMARCKWSPFEWTGQWVYDTYGTSQRTASFNYYKDAHYEARFTSSTFIKQPHSGSVQVFPPNLIQGATLDWIIPHVVFNNRHRTYWQPGDSNMPLMIFSYQPWSTYLYRPAVSYPIQPDGTCLLTEFTEGTFTYARSLFRGDSGFGPFTEYYDYGDDVFFDWTCLAVNLDDAEFI
jgi:hypothetical protein